MRFLAILALCFGLSAQAATTKTLAIDNPEGFVAEQNLVKNGQCEKGLGKLFWSASGGTLSTTTTAANVGRGSQSCSWDSDSASQTLTGTLVSINGSGLRGRNAEISGVFQCNSGTCTHELHTWDGTTDTFIGSIVINGTLFSRNTFNFVMPSAGSIAPRIKAVASNEPKLFYDDIRISEARNIGTVAQAQLIATGYFAGTASCNWQRNNTAMGAFTPTAACPGPTPEYNPGPGILQTGDTTDLPKFTINSLPPGLYEVTFNTQWSRTSTTAYAGLAVNDGTTTSGKQGIYIGPAYSPNVTVTGWFNYTDAGNRSFELYGSAQTANNVLIDNAYTESNTNFSIKRWPTSADQAYKPENTPASWSGYHNLTAYFTSGGTTAFTAMTNTGTPAIVETYNRNFGTVTAHATNPAITFTPPKSGRYLVCENHQASPSSGTIVISHQLYDATNSVSMATQVTSCTATCPISMCGIANLAAGVSSTISIRGASASGSTLINNGGATGASAISWTITELDTPMSMPFLTGSVTSQSTGAERIERAYITNSGTPTVSSQSGNWISSLTDNGTGNITVNFTAGTWSSAPSCVGMSTQVSGTATVEILTAATTSSIVVGTANGSGTLQDTPFTIICMGPR